MRYARLAIPSTATVRRCHRPTFLLLSEGLFGQVGTGRRSWGSGTTFPLPDRVNNLFSGICRPLDPRSVPRMLLDIPS